MPAGFLSVAIDLFGRRDQLASAIKISILLVDFHTLFTKRGLLIKFGYLIQCFERFVGAPLDLLAGRLQHQEDQDAERETGDDAEVYLDGPPVAETPGQSCYEDLPQSPAHVESHRGLLPVLDGELLAEDHKADVVRIQGSKAHHEQRDQQHPLVEGKGTSQGPSRHKHPGPNDRRSSALGVAHLG